MFNRIIQFITGSKLRNKFLFFFIILATAPALLIGGVTLFLLDLSHRQDVSALELQLLGQKNEEIEKFLLDTLGILELTVSFSDIAEIALSDQHFILEGLLAENESFEEVSFLNPDGLETAILRRDEHEPQPQYLSRLDKFTAAAAGERYIGDVYYTLSGPLITLSAPVRNRNGVIIQVLSAEANIRDIVRSIERAFIGTSGYLALFDTNGSLIAHGSAALSAPGEDFGAYERVSRVLSGEKLDGLDIRDRYEGYLANGAVVGAGQRINTTGWALLVEWPLTDANALIDVVRQQIIVFTILSIFAVLLIAPLFANRLIQPIKQLERGALEIRKGNFDKRVEIKTGDELEELGEEFNKMAKGLKRLEELKDEFLFIAAHELKAPVTVIGGYTSMIMGGDAGELNSKMKDFLSQIDKANKNLIKLVQDLLQVARSEAGRIEIEVKPTVIVKEVTDLVGEFQPIANEKSIVLQYESSLDTPQVLADPDKLKEVLSNLISNAVKYTLTGGTVTVKHEVKDNMLVTHVVDSGVGISDEAQKKLFQKFYRVKAEGTEEVSGTGLGLWIVKQLVLKMKGKIWLVSKEKEGSTFSFSLPIAS